MLFSFIDPATNESIVFPIPPQQMQLEIGTKVLSFEPISLGDVDMPRGRKPVNFILTGLLPGLEQLVPERESELSPEEFVQKINTWTDARGASGKKVRFIVTDTDWNMPVFINSLDSTYSGGAGDIVYTLSLTEWRSYTVKEVKGQAKATKPTVREEKPKPKTVTIKSGDTLWAIARKYTGSGARFTELWALNKSKSRSKNPNLIYPGESFTIPAGWLK